MNRIKVAVIGVGRLGSIHAAIYKQIPQAELVGVCDIDRERAQSIAESLSCRPYFDSKDLLKKVEAVSIAVPTKFHYRVAKTFLEHNCAVLIEKPITSHLKQAKDLIQLAKKKKSILQVGHVERFNSAIQAIKDIVKRPKFIEIHRLSPFPGRSLDVGVVLDVMIHDIDIVLGLVKTKIKSIAAVGVNVLTKREDIANARITFADGCVCNLTASRVSDEVMRKIRLFLKDTYISLDYKNAEAFIYKKIKNQIIKKDIPIEKEEPLKKELESFIQCILHKHRPLVSGQEAYEALKVALEIQKKIWHR